MAKLKFSKDFIWGIVNSAYQSEGAYDKDGRGETIWDRYCHTPGRILDGESGDVVSDFYHRYKEDIALMKKMGIKNFRMSIAWARIIPDGKGAINDKGIAFYHAVLDELKENGIEPSVTLYMWDLPQKLQDIGGWANREVTDHFEQYTRILFKEYGEKVKTWYTFDEPFVGAFVGNYLGTFAPGLTDFSTALLVSYNMLLAHGKAVKACHEMLPDSKIGVALNLSDCTSATDKKADMDAAYRGDGYRNRWFMDPLYKGTFPQDMLDWYKEQGVVIPDILPEDLKIMSVRQDFLGLNFYSPHTYVHDDKIWPIKIKGVQTGYPINDIGWEIVPEAIYNILKRIKKDYGDIEVKITANGNCTTDIINRENKFMDDGRIDYMYKHLIQIKKAIDEGVNVSAYFAFCFTDNLEWSLGFTKRFGLVYVDFKTQERIVKESGRWYSKVIRENGFDLVGK